MDSSGIAYLGPRDFPTEDHLLDYLLDQHFDTISCDVETVTIKDRRLIGLGIGLNQQEAVYFRIMPEPSLYPNMTWRLLDQAQTIAGHNFIFDATVLLEYLNEFYNQHPIGVGGWHPTDSSIPGRYTIPPLLQSIALKLADTSLMGQMQGLPSLELANMTSRYVGMEIQRISDILPQRHTMLDLPWGVVANKCLYDCLATNRLYWKMEGPKWSGSQSFIWTHQENWDSGFDPSEPLTHWVSEGILDCYQVGIKLVPLLLKMTARGLGLYPNKVEHWYQEVSKKLLVYSDICTKEGFNPSSPQQVGYTLASRGNFLPFTKSKKQLKTDEETLEELSDPLASVILEHRGLSKLKGTYLAPYNPHIELTKPYWAHHRGVRAYTHYRMDLSTARLSSYDRSLMNIPDYIREIFAPDTGVWAWADYDQIEMRIMAQVSQDPTMMAAYERGEDIHWLTQQRLWPNSDRADESTRLRSKTFGFAMLYRAQAHTLSKHTKLPISTCSEYRTIWLATYPGVDEWQLETIADGWNQGWTETMYGRRCRLPSLDIAKPDHIEKCAVNYPIQGTGFDILARALLLCDSLSIDIALPVHDEILADGIVEFPRQLEDLGRLRTPFTQHRGLYWK